LERHAKISANLKGSRLSALASPEKVAVSPGTKSSQETSNLQFNSPPQHHCRIHYYGRKIGRQEPQGGEEREKGQIRQEEQERQEVVCREAGKGRDRRCFITRRQEGCQPGPVFSVCRTGKVYNKIQNHVHLSNQYSLHHPPAKRSSRSPSKIPRMRTS
jgi:hypothetical protein